MARKKPTNGKADHSSPQSNKSLAIRMLLRKMPNAKASELVSAVKKEYGHNVSQNMIYMVKTKTNMIADGKARKQKVKSSSSPMKSAALWIDAIKMARELLHATGNVANATALLKALDN